MLSKQKIKDVAALQQKKIRKSEGLFIAEGIKTVMSFLRSSIAIQEVYHTDAFPALELLKLEQESIATALISSKQMERISGFATPSEVLAVCAIPSEKKFQSGLSEFTIVLDGIRDPGNLGTIIRLAAWYGIPQLICSEDCAEYTNPKCVQATMGAMAAVNLIYTDLTVFLNENKEIPALAADMEGENIYHYELSTPCFIVIGSESHGISTEVLQLCAEKISIPFSDKATLAPESLNAAVATAVICSEFTRKLKYA
jgi:TrmH family RNA methyltransferase